MRFSATFITVTFSEFCNRLSFYGLQALLVLYLLHDFNISIDTSYIIYGNSVALAFASCIIGGIIADKFITEFHTVFIGVIFMLIGNALLTLATTLNVIYCGIALIVLGVGFIKPGTSCLMGLLYQQASIQKNKAFIYYYTIASIGGIFGPFFYGFGIVYQKYSIGFIFGSIAMIINLILLMVFYKKIIGINKKQQINCIGALAIILAAISTIYLVLAGIVSIAWFIFPILLFSLIYLMVILGQKTRRLLYSLLIPIFASLIFFALLLQMFSSMTVFIYTNVDTTVLGFDIPITWFSAAEGVFILMVAPIIANLWQKLARKNVNINSYKKLLIGLFMTSNAFLLLTLGAGLNEMQSNLVMMSILLSLLCLAVAELCIIPVSISLITTYAPVNYKGMFIGGYYFILASSGYFAGLLAQLSPDESTTDPSGFTQFFLLLTIGVFVLTICLHFVATIFKLKLS